MGPTGWMINLFIETYGKPIGPPERRRPGPLCRDVSPAKLEATRFYEAKVLNVPTGY